MTDSGSVEQDWNDDVDFDAPTRITGQSSSATTPIPQAGQHTTPVPNATTRQVHQEGWGAQDAEFPQPNQQGYNVSHDPGHSQPYSNGQPYGVPASYPSVGYGPPQNGAGYGYSQNWGSGYGAPPAQGGPHGASLPQGGPQQGFSYGAPQHPQFVGSPYGGQPYGAYPAGPAIPGVTVDPVTGEPLSDKSKIAAGFLQFFLGMFGVGRFYIGDNTTGGIQLALFFVGFLTSLIIIGAFILFGLALWALVDAVLMWSGSVRDAQGRKLR